MDEEANVKWVCGISRLPDMLVKQLETRAMKGRNKRFPFRLQRGRK